MSVAVFIAETNDCQSVLPWAARFAVASETDLIVIVPKKSKGKTSWRSIELAHADSDSETKSTTPLLSAVITELTEYQLPVRAELAEGDTTPGHESKLIIYEFTSPQPEKDFVHSIMDWDVRLLLIPAHEPEKSKDNEQHWINMLLRESPCETMVLRGRPASRHDSPHVLVVSDGESDTDIALARAKGMATAFNGELSLLYVRPDDDAYAMHVARYQLSRLKNNVRVNLDDVPSTVILQENLRNAIKKHCGNQSPDLVLVGTRQLKKIKDILRPFDDGGFDFSIGTIRDGVPFANRMLNEFRLWIRSRVPQMDRDQRVHLVDRLNINSNFDFDFVALIILSTMIAALGLVQNSGAVVIGAMLVAPLMTPLVGIGFSLVQGNEQLVKNSLKSVIFGFIVAFAIGAAVGWLISTCHYLGVVASGINPGNSELQGRGHPAILDWFIAFVSGVAAAYAMSRPNLLSALPGVAIAAALVPPIATSGLAFSILDFWLSGGAFVLFFTNIVAIVLGTAITFWAVGVDSRAVAHKKMGRSPITWPRYYFAGFVILSIIIAAGMSVMQGKENRAPESKKLEQPFDRIDAD